MNRKLLNRLTNQILITVTLFLPAACLAVPPLAVDVNPIAFPVDLQLVTPQPIGSPKTNSGSGFFFRRGTNLFIVTAKHVIFDMKSTMLHGPTGTCVAYAKDKKEKGRLVLQLDLLTIAAQGRVLFHTNDHDVAALRIGTVTKADGASSTLSLLAGATMVEFADALLLDEAWTHKLDQIEPADPVFVFGFPKSVGIPVRPQFDIDRPLLRHGIGIRHISVKENVRY